MRFRDYFKNEKFDTIDIFFREIEGVLIIRHLTSGRALVATCFQPGVIF